jgi:hypothetical protein
VVLTVILLNFNGFKSGGLHEKHAVATWEPSQHLLEDREENQVNLCPEFIQLVYYQPNEGLHIRMLARLNKMADILVVTDTPEYNSDVIPSQ